MSKLRAIINGTFLSPDGIKKNCALLLSDNKILDFVSDHDVPSDISYVDAQHHYVSAGLIDLQIYGADSHLYSADTTPLALRKISQALIKSGTTSFMLTLATNTLDVFYHAIEVLRQNPEKSILGLHLEGPFINAAKRGAHPKELIKKPDLETVQKLIQKGKGIIGMVTIAPECCSKEIIRTFKDADILVSAGHSNATYQEAKVAFDAGDIGAVTHLFNAMPAYHHRAPGLLGAIFQSDKIAASIIADGIHVDFHTLEISKRLLGDRLFLITDAVTETRTGTYTHNLQDDHYVLPDGTLSGSALTLLKAIKNCVQQANIPLAEAVRMATTYPANLIGRKDIGRLAPGCKADIIQFDEDFDIKAVMINGEDYKL